MIVRIRLKNLRGHVLIGPTKRRPGVLFTLLGTPTKITQFGIKIGIQKYILWLEITMNNIMIMNVLNRRRNLQVQMDQFLSGDLPIILPQKREQVPIRSVLQDQVNPIFLVEKVIEFDDIGMIQLLMELDFFAHVIQVLLVIAVLLDLDLVRFTIFIANCFRVFLQVTRWTVANEPLPNGLLDPWGFEKMNWLREKNL